MALAFHSKPFKQWNSKEFRYGQKPTSPSAVTGGFKFLSAHRQINLSCDRGAEQYVLELISDGRLSVSRGAEILDESVHDIYRLARKRNVEIWATAEQYEKGRDTAEEVI